MSSQNLTLNVIVIVAIGSIRTNQEKAQEKWEHLRRGEETRM
ncbi:hypothetical protein OIU77_016531, partial [Salix suchowensis]